MESVTREQLRELFSQAGEVTKVDIPDGGRSMVSDTFVLHWFCVPMAFYHGGRQHLASHVGLVYISYCSRYTLIAVVCTLSGHVMLAGVACWEADSTATRPATPAIATLLVSLQTL